MDNKDLKHKDLDSPETHNTNSILIQNGSDDNKPSRSAQLEPGYKFSKKEPLSFKTEKKILPDIKFKRGMPKLIPLIGTEGL